MKKLILICTLGALLLTGCGSGTAEAEVTSVKRLSVSEVLPKKPAPAYGVDITAFENIKLAIPKAWRAEERSGSTVYLDDDAHCAYMFCGCAGDKWLTPEQILEQYLKKYEGSSIIVPLSEPAKDKNGIESRYAAIKYVSGSNTNELMFIFAPDKKLFWLLKGETIDEQHTPDLTEQLEMLAESAMFVLPDTSVDVITGHTLTQSRGDKYTVTFKKDGTYELQYDRPYEDIKTGKYKLYRGKKAINYLLSKYPKIYTEEGLLNRIKNECQTYDDLYAVVITVGEEQSRDGFAHTESYNRVFAGTLSASGKLTMYDHMNCKNIIWTLKE
ncbi:MAG: hypothetical protein IKN17_04135 [Ruminococcus sp.]|nr:hypothetical protein [Ruminococcus sp.]